MTHGCNPQIPGVASAGRIFSLLRAAPRFGNDSVPHLAGSEPRASFPGRDGNSERGNALCRSPCRPGTRSIKCAISPIASAAQKLPFQIQANRSAQPAGLRPLDKQTWQIDLPASAAALNDDSRVLRPLRHSMGRSRPLQFAVERPSRLHQLRRNSHVRSRPPQRRHRSYLRRPALGLETYRRTSRGARTQIPSPRKAMTLWWTRQSKPANSPISPSITRARISAWSSTAPIGTRAASKTI